jgi:hypothetical protein
MDVHKHTQTNAGYLKLLTSYDLSWKTDPRIEAHPRKVLSNCLSRYISCLYILSLGKNAMSFLARNLSVCSSTEADPHRSLTFPNMYLYTYIYTLYIIIVYTCIYMLYLRNIYIYILYIHIISTYHICIVFIYTYYV